MKFKFVLTPWVALVCLTGLSPCMAQQGVTLDLSSMSSNTGEQSLSYRYYLDDKLYAKTSYGYAQLFASASAPQYPYSYDFLSAGVGWHFIEVEYKQPNNIQYNSAYPDLSVPRQLQLNTVWETDMKGVNFGFHAGFNSTTKLNLGIYLLWNFGKSAKPQYPYNADSKKLLTP